MDDMYISPIYEEIVPVDDGKEIQTVGGWDYLLIWRQKIISELVLYFDDTILYEPLIILSPFLFALLGIIVIAKFGTNKTRKKSPVPEKILAYLKEHPGSTQKQLSQQWKPPGDRSATTSPNSSTPPVSEPNTVTASFSITSQKPEQNQTTP